MSCCPAEPSPYSRLPLSDEEAQVQARLKEIESDKNISRFSRLPPDYRKEFSTASKVKGIAVFAFVVIGITAFALLCSGHLTSFPREFIDLFTHVDPTKLMIGISVTAVLICGTGFVIYRARSQEDRHAHAKIFPSANFNDHIEEAIFEYKKEARNREGGVEDKSYWGQAYLDKSTLDAHGSGKAFLYGVKECGDHYTVSTLVPLLTPIYTVCSVAYHAIRMVIVPFWVLVNYAVEACLNRPVLGKKERYKLVDVVLEPCKSLRQVVTSPFYGLAFMAAGIYSLVNPMGGRVLGAKIERDWNGGATRAEGYWSVGGPQREWNFGNLDMNFFLAGCWQPIGIVDYVEGKIAEGSGMSLSRMVNENSGHQYSVYSFTHLEEATKALRQEYASLK